MNMEIHLVQAWIILQLIMLERHRMRELKGKSPERRKRSTLPKKISNTFSDSTKRASHRRLGISKVSLTLIWTQSILDQEEQEEEA